MNIEEKYCEIIFKRTFLSAPITTILLLCEDYLLAGCGSILIIYKLVSPLEITEIGRKQLFQYEVISKLKLIESVGCIFRIIAIANNIICEFNLILDIENNMNNIIMERKIFLSVIWKKKSHTTILDIMAIDRELYNSNNDNNLKYLNNIHQYINDNGMIKLNDFEPLSYPSDDYLLMDNILDSCCQLIDNLNLSQSKLSNKYNYLYVTNDGCIIYMDNQKQLKNNIIMEINTKLTCANFYYNHILLLTVGTCDGHIQLYDISHKLIVTKQNLEYETTSMNHEGRVFNLTTLSFVNNENNMITFIASIGEDRSIILWNNNNNDNGSGKKLKFSKFYYPFSRLFSVIIIHDFVDITDNVLIVTGSENGEICFWNNDGMILTSYKIANSKHITSMCYDNNHQYIYVSTNSGSIHCFNLREYAKNPINYSISLASIISIIHIKNIHVYVVVEDNSNLLLYHYYGIDLISSYKLNNLCKKGILMSYDCHILTVSDANGCIYFFVLDENYSIKSVDKRHIKAKIFVVSVKLIQYTQIHTKNNILYHYVVCIGLCSCFQLFNLYIRHYTIENIDDCINVSINDSFPRHISIFTTNSTDNNYLNCILVVGCKSGIIQTFNYSIHNKNITLQQLINSSFGKNNLNSLSTLYDNNNQLLLFTSSSLNSNVVIYEFLSSNKIFKIKQQLSFPSNFSSIEKIFFSDKLCYRYIVCGFYSQKYFVLMDVLNGDILMKIDCGGANRCWNLNIESSFYSLDKTTYGDQLYFYYVKNNTIYNVKYCYQQQSYIYTLNNKYFFKEIRTAAFIYSYKNYFYYMYCGEGATVYICVFDSFHCTNNLIWCIRKLDSVLLDCNVFNVTIENNTLIFLLTIVGGKKSIYTYRIKFPLKIHHNLTIPISDVVCYLISRIDPKSLKCPSQSSKYDILSIMCVNDECDMCRCMRTYNYNPSDQQLLKYGFFKIVSKIQNCPYFYARKRLFCNKSVNSYHSLLTNNSENNVKPYSYNYVYYQVYLPNLDISHNSTTIIPIKHLYFYDHDSIKKDNFFDLEKIFMTDKCKNLTQDYMVVVNDDDIDPHHRITNAISKYDCINHRLITLVALSNGFLRIFESNNFHYKMDSTKYLLNLYTKFDNNCVLSMLSLNSPTNSVLYTSTLGCLYLIFDCFTQIDCNNKSNDSNHIQWFPENFHSPSKPLLIDKFHVSITSMTLLDSNTILFDCDSNKKMSIKDLLDKFNLNVKNDQKNVLNYNPNINTTSNNYSKSTNVSINENNQFLQHIYGHTSDCYCLLNTSLSISRGNVTTTAVVSCVYVALGLIDGMVGVLKLYLAKILDKNTIKYYLLDFSYCFSSNFHCGPVTDVCCISLYWFVSIAQDRSLRIWHYDPNQDKISCMNKVTLQIYDPSKIICMKSNDNMGMELNQDSTLNLEKIAINSSHLKFQSIFSLKSTILCVFGFGIEFFLLTTNNSTI